jgi:ribosomal protein S27AE
MKTKFFGYHCPECGNDTWLADAPERFINCAHCPQTNLTFNDRLAPVVKREGGAVHVVDLSTWKTKGGVVSAELIVDESKLAGLVEVAAAGMKGQKGKRGSASLAAGAIEIIATRS